jgi:hypothetical protein
MPQVQPLTVHNSFLLLLLHDASNPVHLPQSRTVAQQSARHLTQQQEMAVSTPHTTQHPNPY